MDGLYRSAGEVGRNNDEPQYCDACLSGDYPIMLTDREQRQDTMKVSRLMEASSK